MNATDFILIFIFNLLTFAGGYLASTFLSRLAISTLRTDLYTAIWIARHLIRNYHETGHIPDDIIQRHTRVLDEIENLNDTRQ